MDAPWIFGSILIVVLATAAAAIFSAIYRRNLESGEDIVNSLPENTSKASLRAENGSRVRFRTRPDPLEVIQVLAVGAAQVAPPGATVLLAGGTPATPVVPPVPVVGQPGGPTTVVVVTISAGAVWLQYHNGTGYGPYWRVAPGTGWSPPTPPAPGSTVYVRVSADGTNWSPEATYVVA